MGKINKQSNNFIHGWYMDTKICDDLISFFEANKQHQEPGSTGSGVTDFKKSTDISIAVTNEAPQPIKNYFDCLDPFVKNYIKMYPHLNEVAKWRVVEKCNIQKYKAGEAFFGTHCENSNINTSHRMLVFQTYLNTVTDGGETEFTTYNLKMKAKKGLTIFFPSGWTHPHRGVVSLTQEKYIITGWFSYVK